MLIPLMTRRFFTLAALLASLTPLLSGCYIADGAAQLAKMAAEKNKQNHGEAASNSNAPHTATGSASSTEAPEAPMPVIEKPVSGPVGVEELPPP